MSRGSKRINNNHYDLIVIGAGIHGAGVAQAAASMGYRVLILEQTGIASATSSRSSKLIHGGLRYLETGQFGLVKECLAERRILLDIAPQLVHLLAFNLPLYRNSSRKRWQIALGLRLYRLLAGFDSSSRFSKLNSQQITELDGLRRDQLLHVYRYFDAQTDDKQLTRAVINSATEHSAQLQMPAQVFRIEKDAGAWRVHFRDAERQAQLAFAACVVNAAGPWVNSVNALSEHPVPMRALALVQGTHIVVQREAKPQAYYVESPRDQRAVFVLPWNGMSMIGTTETEYQGDPAKVTPQQIEVDYLIECFNAYFPSQAISESDVIEQFAGLRVLPKAEQQHSARSRDTILLLDAKKSPGFVSIYGGKLTAFRKTAERVMQLLSPFLPAPTRGLNSDKMVLRDLGP